MIRYEAFVFETGTVKMLGGAWVSRDDGALWVVVAEDLARSAAVQVEALGPVDVVVSVWQDPDADSSKPVRHYYYRTVDGEIEPHPTDQDAEAAVLEVADMQIEATMVMPEGCRKLYSYRGITDVPIYVMPDGRRWFPGTYEPGDLEILEDAHSVDTFGGGGAILYDSVFIDEKEDA